MRREADQLSRPHGLVKDLREVFDECEEEIIPAPLERPPQNGAYRNPRWPRKKPRVLAPGVGCESFRFTFGSGKLKKASVQNTKRKTLLKMIREMRDGGGST